MKFGGCGNAAVFGHMSIFPVCSAIKAINGSGSPYSFGDGLN